MENELAEEGCRAWAPGRIQTSRTSEEFPELGSRFHQCARHACSPKRQSRASHVFPLGHAGQRHTSTLPEPVSSARECAVMPALKANKLVETARHVWAHDTWQNRSVGRDAVVPQNEPVAIRARYGRFKSRHRLQTARSPVHGRRVGRHDVVRPDRNDAPARSSLRANTTFARLEKVPYLDAK